MRLQIDSLVQGKVGVTDRVETMRVFSVGRGQVAGINEEGRQRIMYTGAFEIIGEPRPERQRTDIPVKLR